MFNRIVRTWVVVLASLGLLMIGVVVSADNTHSGATSHTSAAAQQQLVSSGGVFGWD